MRYFIFGFLIIIAFSCCDITEYETNKDLPRLRNEWASEYEAWKKLDIQNYSFIYSLPEILGDEWGIRITVKNGQFYESIDIRTGENEELWHKDTIDDIFIRINNSFDYEEKKLGVSKDMIRTTYKVKYDPEYHFPAYHSVVITYKQPTADNSLEIIIYDFTIIDE